MKKTTDNIEICGILVQTNKNQEQQITKTLNAIKGVEVHAAKDYRLVVTIEQDNQQQIIDTIDGFNHIDGIASTALVYQHSESIESLR